MDDSRFDALSRALGAAVSRRSGMAALGALLAGAAAEATVGRVSAKKPKPEGPCGDGSRADNICSSGKDCCTGICDTSLGKSNKDGKGRCRCVRRMGACTADENCCGGRACVGGLCGATLVPLGAPCNPKRNACDGGGTCQTYTADAQSFTQYTGHVCALSTGETCSGPTFNETCEGVWCSSNGNVCGDVLIENVCTPQTDTCESQNIYLALPNNLCLVSVGGLAAFTSIGGTTAGSSCAADADCAGNEVCLDVSSNSQCVPIIIPTAGTNCYQGSYVCSVAGDCPVKATLTATCPNGACVYTL